MPLELPSAVSEREAYDRGREAGEIHARLAGHDQHFAAINGTIARFGDEMHELVLAVQRLGDQALARQAVEDAATAALAAAAAARWSPVAKALAVLSVLIAAVTAGVGAWVGW